MKEFNETIVFAAADGAPGRILLNTSLMLEKSGMQFVRLSQLDGGAAAFVESIKISAEELDNIDLGKKCQCVVVGVSANCWQMENKICELAFSKKIPVISVFDYSYDGGAELKNIVKLWEKANRSTFTITAITDVHKQLLLKSFSEMEENIEVIGNPLHFGIEGLDKDSLKKEFHKKHSLKSSDMILSIFLAGIDEKQTNEMLKAVDGILMRQARVSVILLDVHHSNSTPEWKGWNKKYLDPWIKGWEEKGKKIVKGIHQDEMLVLADLTLANPLSTTGVKALCVDAPVIQCNDLKIFEDVAIELRIGAILGINSGMSKNKIKKVISDTLDCGLREKRLSIAKKAGIIPEPNALNRLCGIIKKTIKKREIKQEKK